MKNTTKKEIQKSIQTAIESICEDIRTTSDQEENLTRAECIRRLADAYHTVSVGK